MTLLYHMTLLCTHQWSAVSMRDFTLHSMKARADWGEGGGGRGEGGRGELRG